MLSFTRFKHSSGQTLGAPVAGLAMDSSPIGEKDSDFLPPEIVSSVFEHLGLKDLLPCRHVSNKFKQLVDTEAKLRLMALTGDNNYPLVLQAGPPALFDVCEYLPLRLSDFGGRAGYLTTPPLLATLSVAHKVDNPCHSTSMGHDDSQVFQNIVLSITQLERKVQESSSYSRQQLAFGGWNSWEVARENDRIWRYWWDDAPSSTPSEPSSARDSGFAEPLFMTALSAKDANKQHTCQQSLEIGKTIHRATLELSTAGDRQEEHEYRWKSVDLDVFRVLLAHEERTSRTGMRAMVGATMFRL